MTLKRIWYPPPIATAAFVCLVAFIVGAHYSDATSMAEILRGVQIPVSLAVIIAYGTDAWGGLFKRHPTGVNHLLVGVVCAWLGTVGLASWSLLFFLSFKPAWMLRSDVPNACSCLITFGACLHLTAPGVLNGVPRLSALWLGAAAAAAAAFVVMWFEMHPDLRPVTDRLRPYLEDPRPDRRPEVRFEQPPGVFRWEL